ncbi:MAG TPA: SH3 domain-containing protein, partial [Blastocatellia bacterium]|nr:SH3 domain-containing protein [Blastocatellia bacterium]
ISPDDTSEVTRVGTIIYAPPEHHPDYQTDGAPEPLTPSADVYSLAKTIYTSMSGRAPSRYARQQIASLPEPLGSKPWADRLLSVLRKATADRVTDRYQSVESFWSDFAALRSWAVATTAGLIRPDADTEATQVRRRVANPEAQTPILNAGWSRPPDDVSAPNFQPHVSGVLQSNDRLNRARIVIELPEKPHPEPAQNTAAEPPQNPIAPRTTVTKNGRWQGTPVFWANSHAAPSEVAGSGSAVAVRSSPTRRIIQILAVMVLIVCLCALVAAVYRYFADKGLNVSDNAHGSEILIRDGVIGGAQNVNIRADPNGNGNVLAWLPIGTKVRVIDTRGGWLKVKVVEWAGAAPADAPDSGWVDRRFVRFDL